MPEKKKKTETHKFHFFVVHQNIYTCFFFHFLPLSEILNKVNRNEQQLIVRHLFV